MFDNCDSCISPNVLITSNTRATVSHRIVLSVAINTCLEYGDETFTLKHAGKISPPKTFTLRDYMCTPRNNCHMKYSVR